LNISLQQVGKRFNREWVFKNLSYSFKQGEFYALTGANGSGKSTLLQVIAGAVLHSTGQVLYSDNKQNVEENIAYKNIAICAPYLDVVEEFTATELLNFHSKFKQLSQPIATILAAVGLQNAAHKQIRLFSSGMKQRLKLAQAFFSNTSVLLLDEPTSNLDEEGINIYQNLIREHTKSKLVIIASNDKNEFHFCTQIIDVNSLKN
jgi:ABC-type multidrug transport system ATPase subunit